MNKHDKEIYEKYKDVKWTEGGFWRSRPYITAEDLFNSASFQRAFNLKENPLKIMNQNTEEQVEESS